MAEQRKTDFRPPEDGEPPPLDRPTGACVLVAALLSALLRLAAQHLQASNLASFDTEVRGTAHAPVRRPCTCLGSRLGPCMHHRPASACEGCT